MPPSTYFVETRWGGSEESPAAARLLELIRELDVSDEEHPDAWLVHGESGWMVRLDEERFAYLEDPELNVVGHLRDVGPEEAFSLWLDLSTGGPSAVRSRPWIPGPRVYTQAETEAIHERSRILMLESDRQFYESLGPEESGTECKRDGCTRGRVKYSVLCARHHFEQLRGKPYSL